jgi:non-specific serine/threonine protein kinase/serine/threonine-protein kinase
MSWARVEEIFLSALEREPGARPAHLAAACGGDARLRDEVESLLASHERAGSFIEAPAAAFAPGLLTDGPGGGAPSFAGRHVGRYRIERELGRGGMGSVFLARRADDYEKRVAVKLIRGGPGDRLLLYRFLSERQILADLDHPNIARLIDGGAAEDGTPYLVMDYIEGVPVDEYCDRERLSTAARLRLFRDICAAVSYAHRNLVIHRDLKPSNILVTPDGTPKLLDFGIAKLLGPGGARSGAETATAARMMTPQYASPEQVRGANVTTASDIYSLGVMLYKLLTGHHPYSFKTLLPAEIERVICETDPQKPSAVVTRPHEQTGEAGAATSRITPETVGHARGERPAELRRRLKGDLDAIVLTALRKEPERRYASAAQFAEDIRRHLEGRPVLAHKDSFNYRAAKFVRRNRAAVTAAALVVVALVAGLALALWQADVARRERDRAERRFDDVRQLSNALLTDIAPKIERLEGSTGARQALVAQSLKYLDSLAGESADDLVLQGELAAAYEQVGMLQGDSRRPSLGDLRGAITSLEKAQQIRRRLLEINPNGAENRRLLADNLRLLALRKMTQSDAEGGFKDSREALRIYENLVAEQPGSLELRKAFLEAQTEDATSYLNRNRFAEAIPPLQRAVRELEELRRAHPDDTETERILAKGLVSLGVALSWEGRQPEAEAEMARAVAIAESLVARFPGDINLKQDLWKFYEAASGIYEEIDDARSFELCEKSRRVVEEIVAADPANAQARHNLSKSFARLGITAANLGRPAEALGFLERAMAIVLALQEKDPLSRAYDRDVSALYIRIGVARFKQRDFPGALAAFQKSAELYEKQIVRDAANTVLVRDVAIAYRHAGLAHKELAKTPNPQTRQIHLAAEKESYQRGVDALLKAQAQKGLPEVDRQLLEAWRKDIEELEKAR